MLLGQIILGMIFRIKKFLKRCGKNCTTRKKWKKFFREFNSGPEGLTGAEALKTIGKVWAEYS
jgi:hypothetical protein